MTIRDNVLRFLNALIDKEGGNKSAFANKVGVTRAAVTNWTSGQNAPDIETIARIAQTYQVPLSDVLEGNTSRIEYSVIKLSGEPSWIEIPFYGSIAAGTPIEMINAEDTYLVPSKIVNEHPGHRLGVLQIKGNSFNAGGIYDSFFVVVDFDDTEPTNDHDPYAVSIDNETATVKAIETLEDGIRLLPNSYDPTIQPITFDYNKDEGRDVSVLGKVIWTFAPFNYRF